MFGSSVAVGPGIVATRAMLPFSGGIPLAAYLYDCPFMGGTNGCNTDTDGDSIPDDWEINGVPYTDINGQPQRYPIQVPWIVNGRPLWIGADPFHKDVFVEIDFPYLHLLNEGDLDSMKLAFASVPAEIANNPDCQPGINLRVHRNEWLKMPNATWTMVNGWPLDFDILKLEAPSGTALPGYFGTTEDRNSPDAAAIREARAKVFRYCLLGHGVDGGTSGQAELGGNDLYVTLGDWPFSSAEEKLNLQVGTLMHELGHTLGLDHGGGDAVNFKPNYHSIMNYLWVGPHGWQAPGTWPLEPGRLGFSAEALPDLLESALTDCQPLVAPTHPLAGVIVPHNAAPPHLPHSITFARLDLPIDWNDDGQCSPDPIEVDLNYVPDLGDPPSPGQLLVGFNDWAAIDFNFRDDAQYANYIHVGLSGPPPIEMTYREYLALQTILPPFCAGEITGDQSVNVDDLLAVIEAWGACPKGCLQDIVPMPPDGQVNVDELLAVISAWGRCP
jgi:hypothetical protein